VERVQTGTERVRTGSRDLGNGFFEDVYEDRPVYENKVTGQRDVPVYRDEPIYATKYTYDIERWVHDRTERARGAGQKPQWPEIAERSNEREAGRHETYTVRFETPKGEIERTFPEGQWRSFKQGERCIGTFNAFGIMLNVQREPEVSVR
jgi:hypothetical protein